MGLGHCLDVAEILLVTLPDGERRRFLSLRATLPPEAAPVRCRQLRSEDLLRLEHDGVAIGNHTMTHPNLTRCDCDTVAWEIGEAHRRLTGILGHEPAAFSYPNDDWDSRTNDELATLGYQLGFAYDHALSAVPPDAPLRVSRVRGEASQSVDRLAIGLTGLHPLVWRTAERVFRGRRPAALAEAAAVLAEAAVSESA